MVTIGKMEETHPINILIRVPNWIGDAVMCLPALIDMREYFPRSTLTILARPTIAAMLRGHSGIDEVLVYDHLGEHQGLMGFLKLVRIVQTKRFDCAVLFQNAFEAAMIAFLSGISSRIGYATDGRAWLLTQPVPCVNPVGLHHIHYYQQLVQRVTRVPFQDRTPHLAVSSQEQAACENRFPDVFQPPEMMVIGINPGSVYGSAKRWLPERFAEVGDQLVEALARASAGSLLVRCVIVGGPGEEAIGEDIAKRMRHSPVMLSGKTTIREVMGVLTRCAVLVTNDTGPMHLAHALGVPVVAIFGSTDPRTTGPSVQLRDIVQSPVRCSPCLLRACPIDHRCMVNVSVEQVFDRALVRLGNPPMVALNSPSRGTA
ncbi:MAG: lipopolysaccharide heptosyltransferase II [Nitrospirota bacterium]|nr:lipopolysaccharide heptosyltransferase II [Nitrospirota bacterium]